MSRPSHQPTPETRELVQKRSGLGQSQDAICRKLGIDQKTLRKHYAEELERGADETNAEVASAIYLAATGREVQNDGSIKRVPVNTALAIWWSKTRMNPVWREPREIDSVDTGSGATIIIKGGLPQVINGEAKSNGHDHTGT